MKRSNHGKAIDDKQGLPGVRVKPKMPGLTWVYWYWMTWSYLGILVLDDIVLPGYIGSG